MLMKPRRVNYSRCVRKIKSNLKRLKNRKSGGRQDEVPSEYV